jgi:hypothetical protein
MTAMDERPLQGATESARLSFLDERGLLTVPKVGEQYEVLEFDDWNVILQRLAPDTAPTFVLRVNRPTRRADGDG